MNWVRPDGLPYCWDSEDGKYRITGYRVEGKTWFRVFLDKVEAVGEPMPDLAAAKTLAERHAKKQAHNAELTGRASAACEGPR